MKPLFTSLCTASLSLLFVLAAPAAADAQEDPQCASICDTLAGCRGGARLAGGSGSSGGTTVDVDETEEEDRQEDPGDENNGRDDDEEPGDSDGDDGDDGDDRDDRDDEDEDDDGDDDEVDAEIYALCMESCTAIKRTDPGVVAATASCVADLDECWDFDDVCGDVAQVPVCVSICEKVVSCDDYDPCEDRSVSTGSSAGAPTDGGDADGDAQGAPPKDRDRDSDDDSDGADGRQPEEREFHLECDEDGGFNEDEAVIECAGQCAEVAFIAHDLVQAVADCAQAEQCDGIEEGCEDEVVALMETTGGGGRGTAIGGGADSDSADGGLAGGGAGGANEAADQGDGKNAGAGGGGGSASSRPEAGICSSSPGKTAVIPQLIGALLRR